MILQALIQYYERKSASEAGLPPLGWLDLPIDYVIEIDKAGTLRQITPCFEIDGRKRKRKELPLPVIGKQALKHTNSGQDPNLLWDNAGFLLGMADADATDKEKEKAQTRLSCFKELLYTVFNHSDDEGIQAIFKFYEFYEQSGDRNSRIVNEIKKSDTVTFQLNTDIEPILYRPTVKSVVQSYLEISEKSAENVEGVCLVSGERTLVSKNHYPIKGIAGITSEGPLVSFNEPAFESYGRKNGEISPVGNQSMFAYTTALKHLLGKGSEQRIQVGDASTVFWSEKKTSLEQNMSCIFGDIPKTDDPDRRYNEIKAVYDSVHRGRYQGSDADTKFYVLGLSPNVARIAIRFWQVATVGEISVRIRQHFEDLRMVHAPGKQQEYLPLSSLLTSIAVKGKKKQDKKKNVPPNLAGELMKSILSGTSYPYSFFAAAIRRNKSEQKVTYARAAIIKACLNRFQKQQEIQMALDRDNPNPAYRSGRLFAVFEKVQEDSADRELNTTIRDRYYGAASSSPVTVFPTLLKLNHHHLAKLSSGKKVYFDKLIREIISELSDSFAANLNLEDQGHFAVGYYHQRQDFFTLRKTSESGD